MYTHHTYRLVNTLIDAEGIPADAADYGYAEACNFMLHSRPGPGTHRSSDEFRAINDRLTAVCTGCLDAQL